jgi:hypothetical protein
MINTKICGTDGHRPRTNCRLNFWLNLDKNNWMAKLGNVCLALPGIGNYICAVHNLIRLMRSV